MRCNNLCEVAWNLWFWTPFLWACPSQTISAWHLVWKIQPQPQLAELSERQLAASGRMPMTATGRTWPLIHRDWPNPAAIVHSVYMAEHGRTWVHYNRLYLSTRTQYLTISVPTNLLNTGVVFSIQCCFRRVDISFMYGVFSTTRQWAMSDTSAIPHPHCPVDA